MNLGVQELVLIGLIILLLFGAKRLPEIGRAFGKAIGEFRKGLKEVEKAVEEKEEKEDKSEH
ncbi:MAG TPA: twin-arginine translocase TatA/TatE family subunit [bacterium]|nr:twin-arginine translocase TatA/TatE family subunit [bacterium]HOL34362.1 twin-arginine translocase TatA/TatE family subunit [bacterium]HPP07499.1 twin-arginine translocase TatA/TatE family subunit [bacterium]